MLFYFPSRELPKCDLLLSVVLELEAIFLGSEAMGRCFTLVTLCILGGCHTFLQTKLSMSILCMHALLSCPR